MERGERRCESKARAGCREGIRAHNIPPPPGDLHARPRVPCPTVWAFVTYSGIRRGAEGKKMSAATQDHIYGIAKEENNNKRKKPFSTLRV